MPQDPSPPNTAMTPAEREIMKLLWDILAVLNEIKLRVK